MSSEGIDGQSNDEQFSHEQPEVGRVSLWFLRALFVVVTLIVIWFVYDVVRGLT